MTSQKQITVLCGGLSTEQKISVQSAQRIAQNLDKNDRFGVSVVYVTERHEFLRTTDIGSFVEKGVAPLLKGAVGEQVLPLYVDGRSVWVVSEQHASQYPVDVVFPIVHGTTGEDGSLQGLLEWMRVPYVGADVAGSAVCMDKDLAKRLLQHAGLAVVPWRLLRAGQVPVDLYEQVTAEWGLPLFLKANRQGSSVGVFKITSRAEYDQAIAEVFEYDHLVLLEKGMGGREIECAVLGSDEASQASCPGEIKTADHFYSYEAKYLNDSAETVVPAELSDDVVTQIQQTACQAFATLRCQGMARVDFFLDQEGQLFVNELNTLPGFTEISLYTKMWAASGVPYSELLERLIKLAEDYHVTRYHRQQHMYDQFVGHLKRIRPASSV